MVVERKTGRESVSDNTHTVWRVPKAGASPLRDFAPILMQIGVSYGDTPVDTIEITLI